MIGFGTQNKENRMPTYYFYIGWAHESDGACGDPTQIKSQEDLVPQYEAGGAVARYEYEAPAEFAWEVGAAQAFRDNYTAHDTFSIVEEVAK
jgi:hypothetical protein